MRDGEVICHHCMQDLEPARLGPSDDNLLTRTFMQWLPVERATSWLRYRADSSVAELLMEIKYHHRPRLAQALGEMLAEHFLGEGIFMGVECIIPTPLSTKRQKQRGYNQSEQLAKGISKVTGIPVRTDVVERTTFRLSQTRLLEEERRENVRGAFRRTAAYEQACAEGHGLSHPLLLDDVITTGATLSALGAALNAPSVSLLSLALAGPHSLPLITDAALAADWESPDQAEVELFT